MHILGERLVRQRRGAPSASTPVGTAPSPLTACVVDVPGQSHTLAWFHLRVGDTVQYKRQGERGSWNCEVIGWSETRLKLLPHDHDGQQIQSPKPIWTGPRVSRITRDGRSLGLKEAVRSNLQTNHSPTSSDVKRVN